MQVTISARHGHLSTATQEKIVAKVEPIRKFFDRITSILVTADLEHTDSISVELKVTAEHCDELVAVDNAENLMTALDGAIHKIDTQLRKQKEKLKEHRATSHKYLEPPVAE